MRRRKTLKYKKAILKNEANRKAFLSKIRVQEVHSFITFELNIHLKSNVQVYDLKFILNVIPPEKNWE